MSGDGIISTISLPNVTLSSTSSFPSVPVSLDTIADPWNSGNNRLSFNIQINGGSLIPGTTLVYRIFYQETDNDVILSSNAATGNIGLSAVASQNTFGLPADVVALITSRFGSVANFLRLRNQGYV